MEVHTNMGSADQLNFGESSLKFKRFKLKPEILW